MAPPTPDPYQVVSPYKANDGTCNAVFLLPPSKSANQPITVSVPWLYTGGSTLPDQVKNDDFIVALQGDPPTQRNVDVVVTIAANNAWKCAPDARKALMANFGDILNQIETSLETPGSLLPGSTMRLAAVIADNLPAPLAETLFYRYGLSSGFPPQTTAYVDIRPGMRLRIETSVTQFVVPPVPPPPPGTPSMDGYIASGRFLYDVSSMALTPGSPRLVTFDPFLGCIKPPTIAEGTQGTTAGGIIDLQVAGGLHPYWRLFYPPSLKGAFDPGDQSLNDNLALIGTPSYAAIQALSANFPPPTLPSGDTSAVFLGRAIAVPEIPIWITLQGQANLIYVSLGATVANIIERYTTIPLDPDQELITMTRVSTLAVGGHGNHTSNNPPVDFVGTGALDPRVFDLPLIGGDAITLDF